MSFPSIVELKVKVFIFLSTNDEPHQENHRLNLRMSYEFMAWHFMFANLRRNQVVRQLLWSREVLVYVFSLVSIFDVFCFKLVCPRENGVVLALRIMGICLMGHLNFNQIFLNLLKIRRMIEAKSQWRTNFAIWQHSIFEIRI